MGCGGDLVAGDSIINHIMHTAHRDASCLGMTSNWVVGVTLMMRLIICVIALCLALGLQACAVSRPRHHGCGCGMEEHMGQR